MARARTGGRYILTGRAGTMAVTLVSSAAGTFGIAIGAAIAICAGITSSAGPMAATLCARAITI